MKCQIKHVFIRFLVREDAKAIKIRLAFVCPLGCPPELESVILI